MGEMRMASRQTLLATAADVVEDLSSESSVFDEGREAMIPKFEPREVIGGRVLGRGGFCVCAEIEKIKVIPDSKSASASNASLDDSLHSAEHSRSGLLWGIFGGGFSRMSATRADDDSVSLGKTSSRGQIDNIRSRQHVISHAKKTRRNKKCDYVVKSVSTQLDKITFMKGNVDIAMEAKYLSALDHRNIISLVAVSALPPCSFGYFLILERMDETLGRRIKQWMDKERLNKGFGGCFGGAKKLRDLYAERIAASYDVANALFFLHSKNIVFRDIKPDNIGFCPRGVLKLFDFGLCKELQARDKQEDGTYKNMTAMTGAIRYMSPEVGLGNPYNLAADAYSWAMLTWFILALEPPFGLYTENMLVERVMIRGSRPVAFNVWSENIKEIIKCAWDPVISERPSFLEISLVLKQEIIDCDEADTGISRSAATSVTCADDYKTREIGLSDGSDQHSSECSKE
jgi:serine/threonine protein kinase